MCAVYALTIVKKTGQMFVRVYSNRLCQSMDLDVTAPVFTDNSKLTLIVSGRSPTRGVQPLYQATYDQGSTTASDVVVAPDTESHDFVVKKNKETGVLTLKGLFAIV